MRLCAYNYNTYVYQTTQEATATMGSTDVWRPLRSLFLLSSGTAATDSSTLPPRNVFLVTDGHMTEEQPTLQAIRQAVHTTRLFTFGVGSVVKCMCCLCVHLP